MGWAVSSDGNCQPKSIGVRTEGGDAVDEQHRGRIAAFADIDTVGPDRWTVDVHMRFVELEAVFLEQTSLYRLDGSYSISFPEPGRILPKSIP